jgi:hypothetical protein
MLATTAAFIALRKYAAQTAVLMNLAFVERGQNGTIREIDAPCLIWINAAPDTSRALRSVARKLVGPH